MLQANSDLLEHLDAGRAAFAQALAKASAERSAQPGAGGRWSVLECAEHVATAELGMLLALRGATPSSEVREQQREARILAAGQDRSVPRESPARARPSGRFRTTGEALEQFLATRARTIEFLEQCPSDLRTLETNHALLGRVSGREMVLLMAMHPMRHAQQIHELLGA